MTANPKLDDVNIKYVFETAETVLNSAKKPRAGSDGEKAVQHIYADELSLYCDEIKRENFKTHPGAGTLIEKTLCVILIICSLLFASSVNSGNSVPACISLIASLAVFCVFAYTFIFDGKKLNFIVPAKESQNLLGIRYSRYNTASRVVLVARSDAPQHMRLLKFGNKMPFMIAVFTVIGNTLLFCGELIFLFSGAPENSNFFDFLKTVSLIFIPFYAAAVFVTDRKRTASGVSSSIIPSSILLALMKQLHDNGFRYEKTEICCLISGSEYSSRAGSYAFAEKHRRLYKDVPTVFIPLDELTTSKSLSLFFKDGGGTKGSSEVASVIGEAADNLKIEIKKENYFLGSSTFTPFTKNYFASCSLGTSKKHTAKCFSEKSDNLSETDKKTIGDIGALLIETLNYYDG